MRNNTVILIKNLAQRGLMHMFGANVFNKIISFSGTILLVRILSKGEYGVYAYVQNILSFFLLLNGLGVVSGLLQYGSVYRNSPLMYAFFKYGLRRGVIGNIGFWNRIIWFVICQRFFYKYFICDYFFYTCLYNYL